MKNFAKLCVASALLSSVSAYAATPGGYAGLGLGLSKVQTSNQFLFNELQDADGEQSKKLGGLGGRVFAGFNFNQFVGVEMGFAKHANSKYKTTLVNGENSSIAYKVNALDLVAKAYLPLGTSNFNLYGIAGAAYVSNTVDFKGNAALKSDAIAPVEGSHTYHKIRPVYGVGASYVVPESNLTTSLEYTRTQGVGNLDRNVNAIPSVNFVSLNLAYNFN